MALNVKNRVFRSASSSTSAPAGRSKDSSSRKDYSYNSSAGSLRQDQRKSSAVFDRFRRVMTWSNTRKVPLVNFMIIVIFMVVTLSTSLMLRTQMAELSFEQTATQSRISRLRQDVEARQAKLDTLEAELPAKAQKMGMISQQGSIAIDLSDYAAKRKHKRSNSEGDKSKKDPKSQQKNKQQNQQKQNQQTQQKQTQQKQTQQKQNQQRAKQEKH